MLDAEAHQSKHAPPTNTSFGRLFAAISVAASVYFAWKGMLILGVVFGGAAAILIAVTLLAPSLLAPLNILWFKFGLLLGRVVNPVVMGLLFHVLITPVALATRLVGRDELRLKRTNANSHWIEREGFTPRPESFKNQF